MRTLLCALAITVGAATAACVSHPAQETLGESHQVTLQVRAGAGGGNPNRIDMNGTTSIYIDRFSSSPLDLDAPASMREEAVAHCTDGRIPRGKTFVVTKVEYKGSSVGDSNGSGEFLVMVAGESIVQSKNSHLPTEGVWHGQLQVHSGDEGLVFVQVRNSSAGSANITGYLIDTATQ